jgi:hypothetical protein
MREWLFAFPKESYVGGLNDVDRSIARSRWLSIFCECRYFNVLMEFKINRVIGRCVLWPRSKTFGSLLLMLKLIPKGTTSSLALKINIYSSVFFKILRFQFLSLYFCFPDFTKKKDFEL